MIPMFFGLLVGCPQGKYVNVDPIYTPVQEVHQSFYLQEGFAPAGKKIAVLDFKADGGEGQVFADILATQLFQRQLQVVERQNISVLANELRMGAEGSQNISDKELLAKIGKMVDADVVIVGGVVAYDESIGGRTEESRPLLPFSVTETLAEQLSPGDKERVPRGTTIYRWTPGAYKTPAGLAVSANVYASARAIEVATGKIVWIDTVNVQTQGITSVTGLERLGRVMAGNFTGENSKNELKYIWNGDEFKYPANWEEVQEAWAKFKRQRGIR